MSKRPGPKTNGLSKGPNDLEMPAMPRAKAKDIGEPPAPDLKYRATPLGIYLRLSGVSQTLFARTLGCNEKSILEWLNQESSPSFAYIAEMERITKGAIPMESWIGVGKVKAAIADIRAKQSEEVQGRKSEVAAGGFATPEGSPVKRGRGRPAHKVS